MSRTQADVDYLRAHQADSHQVPNAGLDEFLKQINSRDQGHNGHLPGKIGDGGATANDSQRRTLPGKVTQPTDPDESQRQTLPGKASQGADPEESQRSILPQKIAPSGSPFDLHPVLPPSEKPGVSKPLPWPGDANTPNDKLGDAKPLPWPGDPNTPIEKPGDSKPLPWPADPFTPSDKIGDSRPLPSPGDFTPSQKPGDSRPLPAPSKDSNDVNKMLDGFLLTGATP